MNWAKLHIFYIFLLFFVSNIALAQDEAKIELGKKTLLLDETFTIKVSIKNTDKAVVSAFPDLQNFTKEAKQKTFSKSQLGYIITQSYTPTKEGVFKIPTFTLNINGKDYTSDAFSIAVNVPKDDTEEVLEVISPEKAKSNAFLSMKVDKSNVFVGEGFRVSLAFYVAENSTIDLAFPDDLNAQVDAIAKRIKSPDCLEERLTITNLAEELGNINGKKYRFYKFFEAVYFPLNSKPINIPIVELRMLEVSKKNTQKESVVFKDLPQKITVTDLPQHPLKDKVSAGNFSLVEQIETRKLSTGKSFSYLFKIVGDGNFSTVNAISPTNDSFFDFYPPDIKEIKVEGKPSREKVFRYRVLPKDSGQHQLDKYFYWVYFNTKTEKYDTLKSSLKIKVLGKTIASKETDNSGDIFAGIEKIDTSRIETNYQDVIKNVSNLCIICMLIGSVYLFVWSNKNKTGND